MAEIKTKLNVGDIVWWVHSTGKVYKGIIEGITCCDYQGALYCHLLSQSFEINPHPVIHYSYVFHTRKEAEEYAEFYVKNEYYIIPMCMKCHYAAFKSEE